MSVNDVLKNSVLNQIDLTTITTEKAVFLLGVSALCGLYVLAVYIFSSRKSFYSVSFAKTLLGMSIITTAIILAMQASIVVSLGMVGALSIVRFRNAVKDPVDLLFLFWAISSGIICGTGLLYIAVICHLAMTVVLLGLDFLPIRRACYILVVNGSAQLQESDLTAAVKKYAPHVKVRTRNVSSQGKELLLELRVKHGDRLVEACTAVPGVTSVSLISHDGELRY